MMLRKSRSFAKHSLYIFNILFGLSILLSSCGSVTSQATQAAATNPTLPPSPTTAATPTKIPDTATAIPPTSTSTTRVTEAAFTAPTPIAYADLLAMFKYDPNLPLDIQEKKVTPREGMQIHDISYASPKSERVTAYLVTPPGTGPFAGLIFLHSGGRDRDEFLAEALDFAKLGVVSLLPNGNYNPTGVASDRDQLVQIVVSLQRGMDLLTARKDVDPKRVGYIGLSDGADIGGILAGVEKRIKAYVLMSGDAHPSKGLDGMVFIFDKDKLRQYIAFMEQLDSVHFIGHAAPAALLFQNGQEDSVVPKQDAIDFQNTGSEPKVIKWYNAGHTLSPEAAKDRMDWLREQLSLK